MAQVEGDAIPFNIPEEENVSEEKDVPKDAKEKEKPKKKENPKKSKSKTKKDFFSDSSEDSSDDCFDKYFKSVRSTGPSILINKGHNIHIGNSYQLTQIHTAVSNINVKSKTPASESAAQFTECKKRTLPEDLSDSVREIESRDMHLVAIHIASDWKKLARFLPPKGKVFSEGQLRSFEENNPRNVEEAIYQMLNAWKEEFPDDATIGNLAKTLNTINKYEIAIKLTP